MALVWLLKACRPSAPVFSHRAQSLVVFQCHQGFSKNTGSQRASRNPCFALEGFSFFKYFGGLLKSIRSRGGCRVKQKHTLKRVNNTEAPVQKVKYSKRGEHKTKSPSLSFQKWLLLRVFAFSKTFTWSNKVSLERNPWKRKPGVYPPPK